jgi:hypothetical protein
VRRQPRGEKGYVHALASRRIGTQILIQIYIHTLIQILIQILTQILIQIYIHTLIQIQISPLPSQARLL